MTKTIDSLTRGMLVLDTLRRRSPITLTELHRVTAINKTTLLRILRTLECVGWVERLEAGVGYSLSSLKHDLDRQLQQAASYVIDQNAAMHSMSIVLAVPRESEMAVLNIWPSGANDRHLASGLSFLKSAEGQVYLSFCNDEEHERVLERIRATGGREERMLQRELPWFEQTLLSTRKAGYAWGTQADPERIQQRSVLAVPVVKEERVLASLSVSHNGNGAPPAADLYRLAKRAAVDIARRITA